MCLLEDGITNGPSDRLGDYGVERLGVLDDAIIVTSGECVRNVGGGYKLIFGDNIAISIACPMVQKAARRHMCRRSIKLGRKG